MAIGSLILAIVSLVIAVTHFYVFGFVTAAISIVLGILAIAKKKGKVVGIIGIVIAALSCVLIIITLL